MATWPKGHRLYWPPPPSDQELNPVTGEPWVVRCVKARDRPPTAPRPVMGVAFTDDGEPVAWLHDEERQVVGDALLAELQRPRVPWIVATHQPGSLWRWLDQRADERYRASGYVRLEHDFLIDGGAGGDGAFLAERAQFTGFRWGKAAGRLVLDPAAFSDDHWWRVVGLVRRSRRDPLAGAMALAVWGTDVARWCAEVGFAPKAGRGGISAQALRDTRWFPRRRRKVSAWCNDVVRPRLPGNHYLLADGAAGRHPQATEVDLRSAHHQAARQLVFTDPDDLYLRGWVLDETPEELGVTHDGWRPGDRAYDLLLSWTGLLRLEVEVPETARAHPDLPPPGHTGEAWVWTVDLDELREEGVRILRVIGGALSSTSSDALNRYGEWAREQLARASRQRQRWLKPLLLSTYGVLAQAPRKPTAFTWHPTPKGRRSAVVLGSELVSAFITEGPRELEPGYVNVTDRGLIEAWTRSTIRRAARALERQHEAGMAEEHAGAVAHLLAIRADSIIVTGQPVDGRSWADWATDLTAGAEWREAPLTNLELYAATHYEAEEGAKLPGVPREGRQLAIAGGGGEGTEGEGRAPPDGPAAHHHPAW